MTTALAATLLQKYGKKNAPALVAGDTVRVHQRIKEGDKERIQIFEGLVIAVKHGTSLDASFTVRKIATGGIGVERTYPLHSPNVVKVERLKTAEVSRSKLYYMRDRLGKSARFKKETRTPMAWDESGAAIEVFVDAMTEADAEMVAVQPEGTVEAEALAMDQSEETAPEEVMVAAEAATVEQEKEVSAEEAAPEKE